MTSVDELQCLVLKLKAAMTTGQLEKCFVISTGAQMNPVEARITYSDTHPQTVSIISNSEDWDEENSTMSFGAIATLEILFEDSSMQSISGKSKPCLLSQQSSIMAAHELLLEMSKSPLFTRDIREDCSKFYRVAYLRGKVLTVGDVYPFPEDIFLEFKGGNLDDSAEINPWSEKAFEFMFRQDVVKSIAAFINSKIMIGVRPTSPCRIVFGVLEKGRTVQGILHSERDHMVLAGNLRQIIRDQFERKIYHAVSYGIRIGIAADVHIDVIAPRTPFPIDSSTISRILVTVSFTFDKHDFSFPCVLTEKNTNKESILCCYYRCSNPELRTRTLDPNNLDDLRLLFPLGLPGNISLYTDDDNNDIAVENEK